MKRIAAAAGVEVSIGTSQCHSQASSSAPHSRASSKAASPELVEASPVAVVAGNSGGNSVTVEDLSGAVSPVEDLSAAGAEQEQSKDEDWIFVVQGDNEEETIDDGLQARKIICYPLDASNR